jgi:hypothetical protein
VIVSIRHANGTFERVLIQECWIQAVHGGQTMEEPLHLYHKLLCFGDYYKADERCCEHPIGCDCDQDSRGIVFIRGRMMFVSYDGKLPRAEG